MADLLNDSIDDLRQKGNHEFSIGNIDNAHTFYSLAIEKAKANDNEEKEEESVSALIVNLCNRSACLYLMEDFEKAKQDAQEAWQRSKEGNVKAAYRLAKTMLALNQFDQTIAVLEKALSLLDSDSSNNNNDNNNNNNIGAAKSLKDLLNQATKQKETKKEHEDTAVETSIKCVKRPISIREFEKQKSLGVGNFSEIIIAKHKQTQEMFALKILEKKQAADLAKRQHPNVYNEIAMEARVLLQHLPPHPNIVQMFHSFQDYYNLYYLMDLHNINPDLWSQIRYQDKMVGCHPSQTKVWLLQLIDAIQHIHQHGIVHRDLKPENILLNHKGHIVVIDFGTAKDLQQTDLNGPEFVGTPDFMSPEAVTGFSGMPKPDQVIPDAATQTADLWALGAVAFILLSGHTPFWSPSPYLSFLRIKRGLLCRNKWGIPDDDAWDFIQQLMQVDPTKRLGADCFQIQPNIGKMKMVQPGGYDVLRKHKYFDSLTNSPTFDKTATPIPSLKDLCVRACAKLAQQDALDLDICEKYPPGCGDKRHDMMLLPPTERLSVLHVLERFKTFSDNDETRVFRRFVTSDTQFIQAKIRQDSRDFVGLTQMNDNEGKPKSARGSADPYAKKEPIEPTPIVHVTNPFFLKGLVDETDEAQVKAHLKALKKSIATINRTRPKLVICSGNNINDKCRKLLGRISDSIPVVLNDGSAYFSVWINGAQGLILSNDASLNDESSAQMTYIREQMEQCRMSKHELFVFVNGDPFKDVSQVTLKRLARGRAQLLVGLSSSSNNDGTIVNNISYKANETVGDDNISVKSTDSTEDDADESTMKVVQCSANALRWITTEEGADWKMKLETINV